MQKVLLVSCSGYFSEHDSFLQLLINDRIDLFAVWGKDCQVWENVMDELCVGDGSNPIFIATTSHPSESLEEVKEFVESYLLQGSENSKIEQKIQIIEI